MKNISGQEDLSGQGLGSFAKYLEDFSAFPLHATSVEILQMNITRRCNLCCRHCHVGGAPDRKEEMSRENMEACLRAAAHPKVTTIDITGGSPEMHPHLEWFLGEAGKMGKKLMVRSNGVILLEDDYKHFLDVYADNRVEVVVSLPNLHSDRTERMRGDGIFKGIVTALKKLNDLGYGQPNSDFKLHLVHNPVGAFLPGSQQSMENEYRTQLRRDHGIEFNQLFCLTNCPVGRYLDFLKSSGNLQDYMELLKSSFNATTIENLMCRITLSVGYDGKLYDCDFNQILDLPLKPGVPAHIQNFDFDKLAHREIVVRNHCFACTAGCGSSCQGALD